MSSPQQSSWTVAACTLKTETNSTRSSNIVDIQCNYVWHVSYSISCWTFCYYSTVQNLQMQYCRIIIFLPYKPSRVPCKKVISAAKDGDLVKKLKIIIMLQHSLLGVAPSRLDNRWYKCFVGLWDRWVVDPGGPYSDNRKGRRLLLVLHKTHWGSLEPRWRWVRICSGL